MEESAAQSTPFPRTSPTKRSFDVAFLTGVHDPPLTQSPDPSHSPVSSLSNSSSQQPSSPDTSSTSATTNPSLLSNDQSPTLSVRIPSPSGDGSPLTSAFTKVTRTQESSSRRGPPTQSPVPHSLSEWSHASSLSAVTSFLSGSKNLAPLLATSGIFNPSLNPLFPPDRLNNNFVEEYLKSHQNIMAGKSVTDSSSLSPTEALSRLRSSMYSGSSDPYKLPFGSLDYPLVSQPSAPAPPKISSINSIPFIPPSPVAAMIPNALNTLNMASQNVCAKCNLSFRMTSDLVYHMRSQHKREPDPHKKRRNDRLKCSICGETFRERHHLTRHMTAHQDRSDEPEDAKWLFKVKDF